MTKGTCYAPDCTRGADHVGLCGAHYQQKAKGKPFTPPRERTIATQCKLDGCNRPTKTRGLCNAHYQQELRGVPFSKPREATPRGVCRVLDCEEPHSAQGYCQLHYRRVKRTGSPNEGRHGTLVLCSVDGCQKASRSRGMCDMHFKREWRGEMAHEVTCAHCGETKPAKLPNLTYCSRSCASKGNHAKGNRRVRATPLSAAYRAQDWAGVIAEIRGRSTIDSDGCWVWSGGINEFGYAIGSVAGKNKAMHRVSLEARLGYPLGGIQAHHVCANRACVNPDHLQPAHQRDNVAEMQIRISLECRIEQLEAELRRVDPGNILISGYAGGA